MRFETRRCAERGGMGIGSWRGSVRACGRVAIAVTAVTLMNGEYLVEGGAGVLTLYKVER
jgi:hypothetical protein